MTQNKNSLFLSSAQAACTLGFPKKTTVQILQARGVVPIDLGVGAGRGYDACNWIDEGLSRMRLAIVSARAANRTLAR